MNAEQEIKRLLHTERPERTSMETVAVRIHPELFKEIEKWVHAGIGSRSDILRKLIELGRQSLNGSTTAG